MHDISYIRCILIYAAAIITHHTITDESYRSLIPDGAFDQLDKRRTKGKNPTFQVIVSPLDDSTYSRAEPVTDSFRVQMSKPFNTLKNVNSLICAHYRLPTHKILQVSHFSFSFRLLAFKTPLSSLLYSTLLYSTLLYSTLLYSTLLYFTLLYSTSLHSTLLYPTLLHSTDQSLNTLLA